VGKEELGRISGGELSLVYPDPVPNLTVWNKDSFTERSWPDEDDITAVFTTDTNTVTFSDSTVKGFVVSALEFDGTKAPVSLPPYMDLRHIGLGLVKDIIRVDANSGSCLSISYWYVDKAVTINGQLKWKEVVTSTGSISWVETGNHEEQWNLTLQPGWNKVQCNSSRNDTSSPDLSQIDIDITESYTNAPADISDFKWTADPPR
jgi:hypothetical protein